MSGILFLCTGNYYRSRFAELLFNHLAQQRGLEWRAGSAGLAVERGVYNVGPIAPSVLAELRARSAHLPHNLPAPRQAQAQDFAAAQRIVALYEPEHRPLVEERFPSYANRVSYWQAPDVGELPASLGMAYIASRVQALLDELDGRAPA